MSQRLFVDDGDTFNFTFDIPDDANAEFEGFVCVGCKRNRKRDFHMNGLQAAEHVQMHVFNGETIPENYIKWFKRVQKNWREKCAAQNKALREQAAKDANKVYAS